MIFLLHVLGLKINPFSAFDEWIVHARSLLPVACLNAECFLGTATWHVMISSHTKSNVLSIISYKNKVYNY